MLVRRLGEPALLAIPGERGQRAAGGVECTDPGGGDPLP
jgi:hypothetical protein